MHNPAPTGTGSSTKAGEGGRTLDIHVGNVTDSRPEAAEKSEVNLRPETPDSTGAAVYAKRQKIIESLADLPEPIVDAILAIVALRP
jgi:hypothetical protein